MSEHDWLASVRRAAAVALHGHGNEVRLFRESRLFRTTTVAFRDGYVVFTTGSGQRGMVPIDAVDFAGAEERREPRHDRGQHLHHEYVAYLTLYGSGTALASGRCRMGTACEAADWINAVLNQYRAWRCGNAPDSGAPSCANCGARGVPKGRFCANCGAPLAES